MNAKMIAAGELVKNDDLIVTASVAALYKEDAAEESGAADSYLVALHMNKSNGDTRPSDALSYDDVAAEVKAAGGEMKVPGLDGAEDFALEAPAIIRVSKTRSFEYEGAAHIVYDLRYEF
jgi:hypothetical protein